jgi:hypothetical protein
MPALIHPPEPYLDFKTPQIRAQWESDQIHPALRVLVLLAALLRYRQTGRPAVVTSLLREGDPHSPHCARPCRGADLRTRDSSPLAAREWEAAIYRAIAYQGDRHSALYHDVGQGDHMHLQVSPVEPDPRGATT